MIKKQRRKQQSIQDRLSPCIICGFPLTHRHHILAFASWGEGDDTISLCPTCHELFHLAYNAYHDNLFDQQAFRRGEKFKLSKAHHLFGLLLLRLKAEDNDRITKIIRLVDEADEYKQSVTKQILKILEEDHATHQN